MANLYQITIVSVAYNKLKGTYKMQVPRNGIIDLILNIWGINKLVSGHYFALTLWAAFQAFHTYTYLAEEGRKNLYRKQYR